MNGRPLSETDAVLWNLERGSRRSLLVEFETLAIQTGKPMNMHRDQTGETIRICICIEHTFVMHMEPLEPLNRF